jgi:3-methyladenine DNA glycosylase AlkD
VFDCWSRPEREFQYFAMELAGRQARKAELCRVDLYEYMVLQKSWWDTVDYIASNLVGVHFKRFPDATGPYTERWMDSGNMWLQRTVILFQLKYRTDTDLELLTRNIERLYGSREFFINKAIGWILREYSKTDPGWVLAYVGSHATRLAPLSKREALKWIQNKKNKGDS